MLTRLAEQGLVHVEEAGGSLLYTLNRDHVAAPAVLMLADLRAELRARIEREATDWPLSPVSLSIFGSAARNEADIRSDLDLFLVRPDSVDTEDPQWQQQREELREHAKSWTGNDVHCIELSVSELRDAIREQAPIVGNLQRDAIPVAGTPLARLFRELA